MKCSSSITFRNIWRSKCQCLRNILCACVVPSFVLRTVAQADRLTHCCGRSMYRGLLRALSYWFWHLVYIIQQILTEVDSGEVCKALRSSIPEDGFVTLWRLLRPFVRCKPPPIA